MEETKKAPIRVRVNRSWHFSAAWLFCRKHAASAETCPTLTVSHDNSCDDYVTVVRSSRPGTMCPAKAGRPAAIRSSP